MTIEDEERFTKQHVAVFLVKLRATLHRVDTFRIRDGLNLPCSEIVKCDSGRLQPEKSQSIFIDQTISISILLQLVSE